MNFSEYQALSKATAVYPKDGAIAYCTLGLCGESGEVAEKIKKILRDQGGAIRAENRESLAYELGDVLWYVAQMATELGIGLDMIATLNIAKLQDRQARGALGGSGDHR